MEPTLKKTDAKIFSFGRWLHVIVVYGLAVAAGLWGWSSFQTFRQASQLERDLAQLSAKLIQEFKAEQANGNDSAVGRGSFDNLMRVAPAEMRALLLSRRAAHPALDEDYVCKYRHGDGYTFPLTCATSVIDSGSRVNVNSLWVMLEGRWIQSDIDKQHQERLSEMDRVVAERRGAEVKVRAQPLSQ